DNFYRGILEWALNHRWIFVSIVVVFFGISLFLIRAIGVEFLPQSDEGLIRIQVSMPTGSSLNVTEKAVNRIYSIIEKDVPERDTVFMQIGRSGSGGGMGVESPDRAQIWMTLVDVTKRSRSDKQIIEDLRKKVSLIPGVNADFSTGGMTMGGNTGNLKISVFGYDLVKGKELAKKIKRVMEKVPNVKDIRISRKEGLPEYQIMVDRRRAALYGFNAAQIGGILKTVVKGEEVTKVVIKGEEVGILVRMNKDDVKSIDNLKTITLRTPMGTDVPLSNLIVIKKGFGPVKIEREKQQRVIYINARVTGDVKGAVDAIKRGVSNIVIPPGFTVSYGGSWENLKETIQDLAMVMLLAVIIVYLIMAALFESFFDPFIIMFTLPMTFIGIVWVHILTGMTFNAVSGIGVVMLAGIVVNNGIILVDYTNLLRKRGYDLRNAVILAGRTRLRPILMTMLTTILGLIPMSFAFGSGSEMRTPMARTVIGGLLVSTLFTLVLIPVLYTMFENHRIKRLERKNKKRMLTNEE
ncbi:MAG: AcrB/AcrD/AcrF family protein, partial [Spirochaetes bacterium]